ncbi:MAG: GAF domain-containing protein, partial [Chloroflexi bacterium]|nr:GAF domain-containing protein [Chloroflexota bacterium]
PLHETAPRILEAIGEHLQWDTGVLWLEQRPGTGFRVVAVWQREAGPELPASSAVALAPVEGAVLPIAALEGGRPLWLPDVGQSVGPDGGSQAGNGFRSAIYVPVRSERGVIGVIAMYGRDPKPEEREAAESLATLGNQIGQFIERQRAADLIRELSTPVLPIGERLLLVPLVGQLYPQRAVQLMDHMLAAIRANRARVVVLDVTGVAFMDTYVAQRIVQTIEAARLLGAQVIITGLSSEVCQTLIGLGVDLSKLQTVGDLRRGIEWAEQLLAGSREASRY